MFDVLSAFGLSSAAGLNAYLPLLIVGLLARFTDLIELASPWDTLENPWILGLLTILLVIEMTVDKVPAVDTINDGIQTFLRPVAGAILFAANGNIVSEIHPVFALGLGILVAGSVHAVKATARPVVTATTAGVGNPVVSVAEDILSAVTTVMAIVLPVVTALILLLALFLGGRWWYRRRAAQHA